MEVTIEDFQKFEILIVEIKKVEDIPGSDKLYKMIIDIGNKEKTIVAGIKECYKKEDLIGKQIVFLNNLKPATIRGVTSHGMLLATNENGKPILLTTDKKVRVGSKVS